MKKSKGPNKGPNAELSRERQQVISKLKTLLSPSVCVGFGRSGRAIVVGSTLCLTVDTQTHALKSSHGHHTNTNFHKLKSSFCSFTSEIVPLLDGNAVQIRSWTGRLTFWSHLHLRKEISFVPSPTPPTRRLLPPRPPPRRTFSGMSKPPSSATAPLVPPQLSIDNFFSALCLSRFFFY
jgi:hypothetical protein